MAGVAFTALGFGILPLLRSLMTLQIRAEDISVLYVTMTVTQNMAESLAGPLYAIVFSEALKLETAWLGLPFLVAAFLWILSTTIVLCLWQETKAEVDTEV